MGGPPALGVHREPRPRGVLACSHYEPPRNRVVFGAGLPPPCVSVKRDLFIWQKRPTNIDLSSLAQVSRHLAAKVTAKGVGGETALMREGAHVKLGELQAQMLHLKHDMSCSDLLRVMLNRAVGGLGARASGMRKCQKRPVYMTKEAY